MKNNRREQLYLRSGISEEEEEKRCNIKFVEAPDIHEYKEKCKAHTDELLEKLCKFARCKNRGNEYKLQEILELEIEAITPPDPITFSDLEVREKLEHMVSLTEELASIVKSFNPWNKKPDPWNKNPKKIYEHIYKDMEQDFINWHSIKSYHSLNNMRAKYLQFVNETLNVTNEFCPEVIYNPRNDDPLIALYCNDYSTHIFEVLEKELNALEEASTFALNKTKKKIRKKKRHASHVEKDFVTAAFKAYEKISGKSVSLGISYNELNGDAAGFVTTLLQAWEIKRSQISIFNDYKEYLRIKSDELENSLF